MSRPRGGPFALALALAIVLPAGAAAEVRYVGTSGSDSGACTDSEAPCKTINYAVGQAADGDTIEIGAGLFNESVTTSKELAFVGVGSEPFNEGGTDVRAPDSTESTGPSAFVLPDGGSLTLLRAEGGDGADGGGFLEPGDPGGPGVQLVSAGGASDELELNGVTLRGGDAGSGLNFPPGGPGLLIEGSGGTKTLTAEGSLFVGGNGGFSSGVGVLADGPTVVASFVLSKLGSEFDPGPLKGGLSVEGGAEVSLESSVVVGTFGAEVSHGLLSISRSVLFTNLTALVVNPGATHPFAQADISNSLIYAEEAEAVKVASVTLGGSAGVSAYGATIVSEGGEAALVLQTTPAPPVSAQLFNTIVRRVPEGEGSDLLADGGLIEAESSNFTTSVAKNGGTAPTPGSGSNIAGDPKFRSELGAEYDLAVDSPLIDRGDPSLAFGKADQRGKPRSLDGNGDCIAKPDIGAYELTGHEAACPVQPPAPKAGAVRNPAPEVSAFRVKNRKFPAKKGTKFTYSLSEAATVAIVIEQKKQRKGKKPRWVRVATLTAQKQIGPGSTPFSGRVRGKPLGPGAYRARITATDSAGQASTPRQVGFRIVTG